MTTSNAVLAFVRGARASAETAQSCVVQGWPLGDRNVLKVVLDPDEILRVIEASRPKLIYLAEAIFDAEEEAAGAYEALSVDGEQDPGIASRFTDLIRRTEKANGKPTMAMVGFVSDGVLHIGQVTEEWYEAIEGEFDEKVAEILSELSAGEAIRDTAASRTIRKYARELAAHPAFNMGRPSFEKRLFLAGELFPDQDDRSLSQITTDAQNIDWAVKGGVTVRE
jgi:hypothetical protein